MNIVEATPIHACIYQRSLPDVVFSPDGRESVCINRAAMYMEFLVTGCIAMRTTSREFFLYYQ